MIFLTQPSFISCTQRMNAQVKNEPDERSQGIQKDHDHNNHDGTDRSIQYIVPAKIIHKIAEANGNNNAD